MSRAKVQFLMVKTMKTQPTLYCFKLDPNTGQISRSVIKDYKTIPVSQWVDNGNKYRYKNNHGTLTDAYERNLNQMVHNKVYSFNDDIGAAKHIMQETIKNRIQNLFHELEKCQTVLERMN